MTGEKGRHDLKKLASKARVPCGFLAAAFYLFFARPTAWSVLLGFPLAAAGAGLRIWSAGHLVKGGGLATSGPYAYVRNPLYLGSLFMLLGCVAAARDLWLATALLAAFAMIYSAVMKREEKELRDAYPQEFPLYAREVPGFFPTLKAYRQDKGRHSWTQVLKNREYQAVLGLAGIFVFLLMRIEGFGIL